MDAYFPRHQIVRDHSTANLLEVDHVSGIELLVSPTRDGHDFEVALAGQSEELSRGL